MLMRNDHSFAISGGRFPRSISRFAMRNIQLEIKPGEMVAITGASGVGKTTLLRVMAGLYPPTFGSVLVDDMDLRQIDPAEWRSQIAFLPETANFFYGSLAQNIRLSRPDASDADVARALREMGLESEEGWRLGGSTNDSQQQISRVFRTR